MKIFGIEFAPLNVPLERRLQTLFVAITFIIFTLGSFFCIFLFVFIFFTKLWWINLVYLAWMWWDFDSCQKGVHHAWILDLKAWNYIKNYYPVNFVSPPGLALNPERNYLFCCFPHGVIPTGPFLSQFCPEFRNLCRNFIVKCSALQVFFIVPFFREYISGIGVISCKKETLDFILGKPQGGNVVMLWPGGAEEALYSKNYVFIVKKRKGFIKIALKNGAQLVPTISFGETDLFVQYEGRIVRKFQRFVKRILGFSPVIFNGRGFFQYSFGIIPRRKPITTVVGTPIEVTKVENPTNEEVDALHEKFKQELVNLFEEHKHKFLKNPQNITAVLL